MASSREEELCVSADLNIFDHQRTVIIKSSMSSIRLVQRIIAYTAPSDVIRQAYVLCSQFHMFKWRQTAAFISNSADTKPTAAVTGVIFHVRISRCYNGGLKAV